MPRILRLTFASYTPDFKPLGSLDIVNDGTGSDTFGNYTITRRDVGGEAVETARLTHYPRKLGPWELATQALMRLSDPELDAEWEGPEEDDEHA